MSSINREIWVRVLEANLSELQSLRWEISQSSFEGAYAEVLRQYLKGDVIALAEAESELEGVLADLCKLRLQVRRQDRADVDLLFRLRQEAGQKTELSGEIYFVLAMYYGAINEHAEAMEAFGRAFPYLKELGAERKALRAQANALSAETRIHPERAFLSEHYQVFTEAKRLQEWAVAGNALNNLSREYQKTGALLLALKYANRALAIQRKSLGTINYYKSLLQRVDLYHQTGRLVEARADLEELERSPFDEIKEAVKVLRGETGIETEKLAASWNERLQNEEKPDFETELSVLENQVIQLLSKRSWAKNELVDRLYGNIDDAVRTNRLKALLWRLRQKRPGLIYFQNGRYSLSEEALIDQRLVGSE